MASVSRDKKGWRLFVGSRKVNRKGIRLSRLGALSECQAKEIKGHVEHLVLCKKCKLTWCPATSRWVADLDADPDRHWLLEELAAVGVLDWKPKEKREAVALGAFISVYIDGRNDVKPASKEVWRQGERSLVEHFGADRPVGEITVAEALDYKQWLLGGKLRPYTVRKRLQAAKMFFNDMVTRRLIDCSPFADVHVAAVVDESRNVYVPRSHCDKIIGECPDPEWRAIIALSRYGGLRCPTEVLSLKLSDIEWKRQRIRVRSPKTEHHVGGSQRIIPLFPELVEPLMKVSETARVGAVYVIDRHRSQADSPSGWRNSNLRTAFERIISAAGLEPWPKPFHAMRASCETDLIDQHHPIQAVAKWLGHSPKVALSNYLRVRDEHYDRALQPQGRRGVAHQVAHFDSSKQAGEYYVYGRPSGNAAQFNSVRCCTNVQADGEGFEPPVDLRPQQFSRLPP